MTKAELVLMKALANAACVHLATTKWDYYEEHCAGIMAALKEVEAQKPEDGAGGDIGGITP